MQQHDSLLWLPKLWDLIANIDFEAVYGWMHENYPEEVAAWQTKIITLEGALDQTGGRRLFGGRNFLCITCVFLAAGNLQSKTQRTACWPLQ